jgi:16S rRNA processing protein RimM
MSTPQTPHSDDLLLVGTVVNTVGLRGDVRMHIVSTQIEHLATSKPMLYSADGLRSFRLRRMVHYKNDLYTVDLGGIATRDLADAIRGLELYITRADAAPLAADEYFLHELVGLRAVTNEGLVIGTVREVVSTGASDIVVIAREGQPDVLIPMVKAFIQHLDTQAGTLVVTPIPGLIDD